MDRETVVTLCISLLAIVALGAAAATLDTAVSVGGGDGGSGFGSGTAADRVGSGSGTGPLLPGDFAGDIGPLCYPILQHPLVIAAIFLVFAGVFAYIYHDTREPFSALVVCGVLAIPVGITWVLFAFCGDPLESSESDETGFPTPSSPTNETQIPLLGGGGAGEASGVSISAPTLVVYVLIVIALLGAVAMVLASRGDDYTEAAKSPDQPVIRPDIAAVAHAAGTAADRIAADAAVDNEVFRAWEAMTDALELESPETTTPAMFERAAVEAGMKPDDIAELRRLFEEVRYGGETPTAEREERAVAALRRVEDEYGTLDSSSSSEGR